MLELHNHRKLLACLGVGKELKKTAALEKLREAHRNSSGPRSLTTSKRMWASPACPTPPPPRGPVPRRPPADPHTRPPSQDPPHDDARRRRRRLVSRTLTVDGVGLWLSILRHGDGGGAAARL